MECVVCDLGAEEHCERCRAAICGLCAARWAKKIGAGLELLLSCPLCRQEIRIKRDRSVAYVRRRLEVGDKRVSYKAEAGKVFFHDMVCLDTGAVTVVMVQHLVHRRGDILGRSEEE